MSFKVSKKALWESGASLQRFGKLKFTDKSLTWKAGRIHRAATKVLEQLQEENIEASMTFGTKVMRKDLAGNETEQYEVRAGTPEAKKFKEAWEKVLAEEVTLPLDPFTQDELGDHLNGLSIEDSGALADWLISGPGEPEKAATAGA